MKIRWDFPDITKYTIITLVCFLGIVASVVFIGGKNTQKISFDVRKAESFNEGWYFINPNAATVNIEKLPFKMEAEHSGSAKIFHSIRKEGRKERFIEFYTHHQALNVFFNGKEIYKYDIADARPKWIKTYRSFHHIIEIPGGEDGILCIEIKGLIPSTAGEFPSIKIGSRDEVLTSFFLERVNQFIMGCIVLVFGLVLIAVTAFYVRVAYDTTILYFSVLMVLIGCWQCEESGLLQFIIGFQPSHWFLEYMIQPFILIFSFLFIRELFINKKHIALKIFFILMSLVIAFQLFMQVTGLAQMTTSLVFVNLMIALTFVYILVLINLNFEFASRTSKIFFSVSIFISILAFVISSLVKSNKILTDFILRTGIVFVFISVSVFVIQKMERQFNAVKSVELYKKLAFLDTATGVSNQTAWYTFIENFKAEAIELTRYCLFMFDMNNLKVINDTYGHLMGDKVINSFCECLKRSVGNSGTIYRVGGDEFICLCKGIDYTRATQIINMFDYYVKNQTETDIKFTAAHGYAFFTPVSKSDFAKARSQADAAMYKDKQLGKQGRKY